MKNFISLAVSCIMGVFMFSISPMQVSAEEICFADDGFNGSSFIRTEQEIINYAYKTETEDYISCSLPKYGEGSSRPNTCANIAGATLLGYYDKTYDEMIPNFTAGRTIRDKYIFNAKTSAVQDVIDDLYIRMATNTTGNGTTANNCRNGLASYINSKGRNVTYTNVVSGGTINYSLYDQAVNNETPMILFVSGYTLLKLGDFTESATQDVLNMSLYGGTHTVVAYGRKNIKYYNASNQLIREENFLRVATGYSTSPLVYIMVDGVVGEFIEGNIVAIS